VTMEEVPTEICLTVSISNCQFHCRGCHSPYLRDDIGKPLQPDIERLIARYSGLITCVCLMGEGRNEEELESVLQIIRGHGLKTCLYSGSESAEPFRRLIPLLDYLKLGSYRQDLGGLDHKETNQRFYRIKDGMLLDSTNLFWRERK